MAYGTIERASSSRKIAAVCWLLFLEKWREKRNALSSTHPLPACLLCCQNQTILQECTVRKIIIYHTSILPQTSHILPPFCFERVNDANTGTAAILNPDTAHFWCCPTDQQEWLCSSSRTRAAAAAAVDPTAAVQHRSHG